MKVDLFDFELPRERIAEHPASPRDAARMLDLSAADIQDRIVRELPDILRPGDLLISNDTRVIPARLFGKRGEAKVEVTLHKQEGLGTWVAFAKPAKKLRIGETFFVNDEFEAEVLDKKDGAKQVAMIRINPIIKPFSPKRTARLRPRRPDCTLPRNCWPILMRAELTAARLRCMSVRARFCR